MDFPLLDLMDQNACYEYLVKKLHPSGLTCPGCGKGEGLGVHHRNREPVLDYRCKACGRVFNAWADTVLAGTRRPPSEWVLILRGIAQGQSTASLARELGRDRERLLELRHRLQKQALEALPAGALGDVEAEVDEMYQNVGEKRQTPRRSGRPTQASGAAIPRPRHLGPRPPAGGWRGRPREPRPASGGHSPQHQG